MPQDREPGHGDDPAGTREDAVAVDDGDLGADHAGDPPSDDSHLLFGDDSEDERPRRRHAQRRASTRTGGHRRGALIAAIGVVLVAVIGITAYVFIKSSFATPDYSGEGTTPVQVIVHSGDTASDIADTLVDADVVKSAKAFTDAANDNSDAAGIQPGVYTLRKQMSGANALKLLLDPRARDKDSDVVVTEGATIVDVAARLAKALQTTPAAVRAILTNVSALVVPTTYGTPSSAEGFLYPATYTVDPSMRPVDVVNSMITKFIDEDRTLAFANDAKASKLTPYQELIIASIAQSEAFFPEDMPRVARVILNRIAADMPLQIDATSAYAAKLLGLDPTKIIFSEIDSPYNTYTHDGLPPTPISNPGVDALTGAAQPADGNWLYYVNSDAAGHLFFTNDEAAFTAAAEKCRANNWGCG